MHMKIFAHVPIVYRLSGASGNLSMTYFPFATLTMGTPGTFLNRRLRSLHCVSSGLDALMVCLPIVCAHQVDPVLGNVLDEAVVGIRAFVGTRQSLPALVTCNPESNAVLGT